MARRPRLDRELERYLVAEEAVIVAVRRHWFHLFREIVAAIGATAFALWVDINASTTPGGELLHNLSLLVWWGTMAWVLWQWLNYRHEWFVATDKRFLLFYGFIRRKVGMMPLLKVTDMTYDRSPLGRLIGYGTFRLESAGQQQAMSVIDHVPDADAHYRAICTQLFGPGSAVRFGTGYPAQQPPPPPPPSAPPPPPPGDGGPEGGGPAGGGGANGGNPVDPYPPAGAAPVGPVDFERRATITRPESWYRSSNLNGPTHLGDTGEIPVVRVRTEDDEEVPLFPPHHWVE
jgi:hypothetical protein